MKSSSLQNFEKVVEGLPARHQAALQWFVQHAGSEQPWPPTLPGTDGDTFLASKAKGIYKPEWSDYALSVRQTLGGPYPDKDPIFRPDGTWLYSYFQENDDPARRDEAFTNRGLMKCLADKVPVGVLRQVAVKPQARYQVLGVALVSAWDGGYFFLEGFTLTGTAHAQGHKSELDFLATKQEQVQVENGVFDPANVIDGRERTVAEIIRRRGQPQFRTKLLEAYQFRCAVSGCDVVEALEAAHISPYQGPDTNRLGNGLLLRADLHTLFDLGMLAVDEERMTLLISDELRTSIYRDLEGKPVQVPKNAGDRASVVALRAHRLWSGL